MISLQTNQQILFEQQQPVFQVDRCFYISAGAVQKRYSKNYNFSIIRMIVLVTVDAYAAEFRTPNETDNPCVSYLLGVLTILELGRILHMRTLQAMFNVKGSKLEQIASTLGHGRIVPYTLSLAQSDPYEELRIGNGRDRVKLKVSTKMYSYKMGIQAGQNNLFQMEFDNRHCQTQLQKTLSYKWADYLEVGATVIVAYFTFILVEFYTPQLHLFFICYLFSELILKSSLYVFLFMITLFLSFAPICCLLACCFKRQFLIGSYRALIKREAKLPTAQPAAQEIVEKAEGNCSICIQEIIHEQKVIILKCSDKHVFHENCIKDWTAIRKTCPICRAEI